MMHYIGWHEVATWRVVDADTFEFVLELGCGVSIRRHVRLARCNAPERGTWAGAQAQVWLERLLTKAGGYPLVVYERGIMDKYGRLIAEVYYTRNGEDYSCLSDTIMAAGAAQPHDYGRDTRPDATPQPITVDTAAGRL